MSKPIKDLMTKEYQQRYDQTTSACLVSVIGLDAISTNKLRGELRAKNLRLQVVKNSLAKRAFGDSVLSPLGNVLDGPCALVTGSGSAIDIAKVLVDMKKTYPKIELRVGMLDGDPQLIDVEQLSRMKGRMELLGEVAGILRGPGARLAGCLVGPGGRIAGCFKAIVEKGGESKAEEPAAASV